jgi:hypothetical protein
LHWVLLSTKNAQENAALRYYTPQARSPFWLLKPASQLAHALLLPRVSCSWTVLLPSDTHRKSITSITSVLLPFWPVYWLSLAFCPHSAFVRVCLFASRSIERLCP